ncbi:DinB family protein [Algihabitans albus]|uniref:DinB family protein n=1 Tax=Algihabitans albus TaxID=2164067 RepID=UPI000E5D35BB|nr:DinB family protein [Algihabitans albus]
MISAEYLRTLARYNRWQNDNLVTAADGLDEAERRADRGAFFGSIFGTFNHLLWADRMWMSRLAGLPKPVKPLTESVSEAEDWPSFKTARKETDDVISTWADRQGDGDLTGQLTWHSRSADREFSQPLWLLATHVFNHQTHHRGQIHALLTAAGAKPGATDLPFMTAA